MAIFIDPDTGEVSSTSALTMHKPNYFKLPGYHSTKWSQWESSTFVNPLLEENDGRAGIDNLGAWSTFDRFYDYSNLQAEEKSGRHYIFMCRPDLPIFVESTETITDATLDTSSRIGLDSYFQYLANQHPYILSSLSLNFGGMGTSDYSDIAGTTRTGSYTSTLHKFIPYVTSRAESLQLPDYTIKQDSIVQPYSKFSFPYTTSANESTTGGTFDITFREDANFAIHKMFYAWIYYQHGAMKNIFCPRDRYILYNSIDYATSIYDIMVDATGENIIYWSKYTGCVPISVPMSDFSFNRGGTPPDTVAITFAYHHHEHLDPYILLDLNYNSLGYTTMEALSNNEKLNPPYNTVPIYSANHYLDRNIVGRPIVKTGNRYDGRQVYKLGWIDTM